MNTYIIESFYTSENKPEWTAINCEAFLQDDVLVFPPSKWIPTATYKKLKLKVGMKVSF